MECKNFKTDVSAREWDICICGKKKKEHPQANVQNRVSFVQPPNEQIQCNMFKLGPNSNKFCAVCGREKKNHNAPAQNSNQAIRERAASSVNAGQINFPNTSEEQKIENQRERSSTMSFPNAACERERESERASTINPIKVEEQKKEDLTSKSECAGFMIGGKILNVCKFCGKHRNDHRTPEKKTNVISSPEKSETPNRKEEGNPYFKKEQDQNCQKKEEGNPYFKKEQGQNPLNSDKNVDESKEKKNQQDKKTHYLTAEEEIKSKECNPEISSESSDDDDLKEEPSAEPKTNDEILLKQIKAIHLKIRKGKKQMKTQNNQAIIIIGKTGVGKSTIVNFLSGAEMEIKHEQIIQNGKTRTRKYLSPKKQKGKVKVGSGASETTIPNRWHDVKNDIIYWDCPGFEDTNGIEQDIANAFYLKEIFKIPLVKIVCLVQNTTIEETRGDTFLDFIAKIDKLLNGIKPGLGIEKYKPGFVLIITKGKQNPIEFLDDSYSKIIDLAETKKMPAYSEFLKYLENSQQIGFFNYISDEKSINEYRDPLITLIKKVKYVPTSPIAITLKADYEKQLHSKLAPSLNKFIQSTIKKQCEHVTKYCEDELKEEKTKNMTKEDLYEIGFELKELLNRTNTIIINSENKNFPDFLKLLETNYVNDDREKQSKIKIKIEEICSSIQHLELFIEIDPKNEVHVNISDWVGVLKNFAKTLGIIFKTAEGLISKIINVDQKITFIDDKLAKYFVTSNDQEKDVCTLKILIQNLMDGIVDLSKDRKLSALFENLNKKFPLLDIANYISDVKFLEEKTSIETDQRIDKLEIKFRELLANWDHQYNEMLIKEYNRTKQVEADFDECLETIFINFQKKKELESKDLEFMASYHNLLTKSNDADLDLNKILEIWEKAPQDNVEIKGIKNSLGILKNISKIEAKIEKEWTDLNAKLVKKTKTEFPRFHQCLKEFKKRIVKGIFTKLNAFYEKLYHHILMISNLSLSSKNGLVILLQKNEKMKEFPQQIQKLIEEIGNEKELKDVNLKLLEDCFTCVSQIIEQSEEKEQDKLKCYDDWKQDFIQKSLKGLDDLQYSLNMSAFSAGLAKMIYRLDSDLNQFDEKKFLLASEAFFNSFHDIINKLLFHDKPNLEMVMTEIKRGCNNLLKSGNFGNKICKFNSWEKIQNPKETIISSKEIEPLNDLLEKVKIDREFKLIVFPLIIEYLCDPKNVFGENPQKSLNLLEVDDFLKKITNGKILIKEKNIHNELLEKINSCIQENNVRRKLDQTSPKFDLIIGNFIKMSDIKTILHGKPSIVYARAAFFFDIDVCAPSYSLVIFSPRWHIEKKITVDLSGKQGENVGEDGANGLGNTDRINNDGGDGIDGEDGQPGDSGYHGGHFFGIFEKCNDIGNLIVKSNGGAGRPGGAAGSGKHGERGIDALNPTRADEYIEEVTVSYGWVFTTTGTKKKYRKKGGKGGRGGDSGRAGEGGYGGNPGIIQIFNGNGVSLLDITKSLKIEANQGTRGRNGILGVAGIGEYYGNNRTIWYNDYEHKYENEEEEVNMTKGCDGNVKKAFIPARKRENLPIDFRLQFYLNDRRQGSFYDKLDQEFPMKYYKYL